MTTLVIGGAASGKSAFAEALAAVSAARRRCYLATLISFDGEDDRRVARHREARAGKGFVTLERYTDLAGLAVPADSAVLLECLGNLTANEIFAPGGAEERALEAVVEGVLSLAGRCQDLVVVTNDTFADGYAYSGGTRRFLEVLAAANAALAARFDRVYEVVCGIALPLKGEKL